MNGKTTRMLKELAKRMTHTSDAQVEAEKLGISKEQLFKYMYKKMKKKYQGRNG